MSIGRRFAAFAATLLLAFPAAALPPGTSWTLRYPPGDPVPFQGLGTTGAAEGDSVHLLYGPGIAGFFAGIAAHATVNEAVRNKRTEDRRRKDDQVLQPFGAELQQLRHEELMRLALESVPEHGTMGAGATASAEAGWQVSSVPRFFMTQDRRALVLDNAIGIFAPGDATKAVYTITVRVVSRPREDDDPLATWKEQLKPESVRLLAHSLVLALRDARRAGGEAAAARTVRYLQGAVEKVERAQPVESWCQRLVMRTLRGELLSAPVRVVQGQPACEPGELVRN